MESPDAQETQAETAPVPQEAAPEEAPPKAAPEEAPPEAAPEEDLPEAVPEEAPQEEPPAPKARPKGRPKGSKTQNRRPKATADPEAAEFASVPSAVVETPPDIFEIIRQRQTAQFERRQAFYQSFLPVR